MAWGGWIAVPSSQRHPRGDLDGRPMAFTDPVPLVGRPDPMPKRCARCGEFAGRGRELPVPGAWLTYLRSDRDLTAPVGRLVIPLCVTCARDAEHLNDPETDLDDPQRAFLDDLDLTSLVDEGA